MELDRAAVEIALRAVISWADYDLHKDLDDPSDPDEPDADNYTSLTRRFIKAYTEADQGNSKSNVRTLEETRVTR